MSYYKSLISYYLIEKNEAQITRCYSRLWEHRYLLYYPLYTYSPERAKHSSVITWLCDLSVSA